jgi:hypothetical protein
MLRPYRAGKSISRKLLSIRDCRDITRSLAVNDIRELEMIAQFGNLEAFADRVQYLPL